MKTRKSACQKKVYMLYNKSLYLLCHNILLKPKFKNSNVGTKMCLEFQHCGIYNRFHKKRMLKQNAVMSWNIRCQVYTW